MKKSIIFLALSAFSCLSYASEPQEVLASFHAALASGDTDKASQLLAPDITIYESGFVERSRAEYAGHHLPADSAFAKTSTRKVLRQTERVDGNFAVIWEETETKAKLKGKDVKILGTETAVLQKQGDVWSIVHVHWSSRTPK
jgi:ketosteroid isomerase-like protein